MPVAAADDAGRSAGRRQRLARRRPARPTLTGTLAGHPREHVARRQPEADDHRVARRRRLGADPVVGGDDGADAPVSSPSNRMSRPATGMHGTPGGGVPMATAAPSSMPAAWSRSRGPAGDDALEVVARARPGGSRRRRSRRRSRPASTWSIRVGVRDDDGRSRIDRRRPRRPSSASRTSTRLPAFSAVAAAASTARRHRR